MYDTLNGKIIKGISGFYYISTEKGLFECKAKGLFRKDKIKPLVGDNVLIQVTDPEEKKGNISDILKRKNEIIRPACANIDLAIIVMALSKPKPVFGLLDRILIFFEYYEIPVVLCFNKIDEKSDFDDDYISDRFRGSGCQIIYTSAKSGEGIDKIKALSYGKTVVFTGPSGVGKSSLLNSICPDAASFTGDISKIGRGRHTTRHSELFKINDNSFIMDTPGFSSLDLPDIKKEQLKFYFNEFSKFEGKCWFDACSHTHEPDCAVKKALEDGLINSERYNSYLKMFSSVTEGKHF